jgi:hypothetical protein
MEAKIRRHNLLLTHKAATIATGRSLPMVGVCWREVGSEEAEECCSWPRAVERVIVFLAAANRQEKNSGQMRLIEDSIYLVRLVRLHSSNFWGLRMMSH